MNLKPIGDHIVAKPAAAEEKTQGGFLIADTAKEKPQKATIVAVGKGARLYDGSYAPLEVKAGDVVLFGKYGGTSVKIDGEEYLILQESDILAVLD